MSTGGECSGISVVVPAYNLERCIAATLHSVLVQVAPPLEIIVVDDGSTDATSDRVAGVMASDDRRLLRVIRVPHGGPGAARNHGVADVRGDWVAFLDGDDAWVPEKLACVQNAIHESPDATVVAHDYDAQGADGSRRTVHCHRRYIPDEALLPQLYRRSFLATSCVTVRTSALRATDGFDEQLASAQDYDLWLTLARRARLVFIPTPLTVYAERPGSISSNRLARYRCMLEIAHRHAPELVPFVGRAGAVRSRVRLVLTAHVNALAAGSIVDNGRVLAAAPRQLWRAVFAPMRLPTA